MENVYMGGDHWENVVPPTAQHRLVSVAGSALPFAIIGALFYAALFVKPTGKGIGAEPPVMERRDIFYSVAAPTPDRVWAVGNLGKIVRSNDGGKTWERQIGDVTVNLQSIAAWDSKHAVAVGNGGTVVVTSDEGNTWGKANIPITVGRAKLLRVRTYPGGKAWAVGEMGTVLSSSDFGATWRSVSLGGDIAWNDVAFGKDMGWLVGEFGRMQVTRDGGATWVEIKGQVKSSLNGIYFRNEREGVVVGTEGVLLHTQDGGLNWASLPKVVEQHLFDVLWDGRRWIAVGDKGALLTASGSADKWSDRSGTAGNTWHTQIVKQGDKYILAGYGVASTDITTKDKTAKEGAL